MGCSCSSAVTTDASGKPLPYHMVMLKFEEEATTSLINEKLKEAEKSERRNSRKALVLGSEGCDMTLPRVALLQMADDCPTLGPPQSVHECFAKQLKLLAHCQFVEDLFESEEIKVSEQFEVSEELTDLLSHLRSLPSDEMDVCRMGRALANLWNDSLLHALKTSGSLQSVYSLEYFLQNADRICADSYLEASTEDLAVAMSATSTVGLRCFPISHSRVQFTVLDFPFGYYSHRRRIFPMFEDVATVMFHASVLGFRRNLWEWDTHSEMDEALETFKYLVNSKFFQRSEIALVFTDANELKESIAECPISSCFEEYKDNDVNFDAVLEFIKGMFLKQSDSGERIIYTHIGSSKENMTRIYDDIFNMTIRKELRGWGPI